MSSPPTTLQERLAAARVTATSPKGVVKVVYNGHGESVTMAVRPDALDRYACDSMAELVSAALRAADRAVEALRQHAVDEAAGAAGESAANAVAACFGPGR